MSDTREPSPVNPLPPVVVALALVVFGAEFALWGAESAYRGGPAGIGWRATAIMDYGYFAEALDWMVANGRYPAELTRRFVTYPFVHLGFGHAIFALILLLALGKMVGEVFRGWAVAVVFFGSAIGGALAYSLVLDDPVPLIGGYPAVYGLIGAYSYILWLVAGATGQQRLGAFRLIAVLMGIQLLFTALFDGRNDWVADLGGFATGFALSFLVSPGGWARLKAVLRRG